MAGEVSNTKGADVSYADKTDDFAIDGGELDQMTVTRALHPWAERGDPTGGETDRNVADDSMRDR